MMASVSSESWKCTAQELDVEGVDVPDIDDALLMEMLESSCADEDQLYGVIRSLEAEICHSDVVMIDDGESTTGPSDGGLEDILSDLDSHEGLRSGTHQVEDPFDWAEMDAVANSACHYLLPDWYYMEAEDTTLCYGEARDYAGFYYCGESLTEQVYGPLWQ